MEEKSSTPRILLAASLVGVLVGVIGAAFVGSLSLADAARVALIAAAEERAIPGWLAGALAGSVGALLAAWLAQRYAPGAPQSSASEPPAARNDAGAAESADAVDSIASGLKLAAVDFAGTGMAAGAGFALGPERPAMQIGGVAGRLVGRLLGLGAPERELLLAAAGGAGVATMFNAPLGCAAYTVETVLKRVDLRISLVTLGVGAIAVGVARVLTGRDVNFTVGLLPSVGVRDLVLFLLLGAQLGMLAYVQAQLIVKIRKLPTLARLPGGLRAAFIGAIIGWLAWRSPALVGVGDALLQDVIDGGFRPSALAAVFLVRFLLGPLSLAASTPGGYFTPVLLLGALGGAAFSALAGDWLQLTDASPTAFVLAGMAVSLATVAHAPFTGILLTIETTGALPMTVPMIVAVFGAAGAAYVLRSPSLGNGLETAMTSLHRRGFGRNR